MPLVHLGWARRRLGPIVAPVCTGRDSLAHLALGSAASAATVYTEEEGEEDEGAAANADADYEFLVLLDPA
jgi:hypothetical protein